jgi:hypothetical protein
MRLINFFRQLGNIISALWTGKLAIQSDGTVTSANNFAIKGR